MVIKNNWTPLGCGADFLDRPANKTNNLSEFPCDLVERIKTIGLSIEDLFLAWEIARLAGKKLNGRQHRALLTLILAVRLSSSEGSSRLPLEKGSQLKHTRLINDYIPMIDAAGLKSKSLCIQFSQTPDN